MSEVYESSGVMGYTDDNGDLRIHYPVTKAENVDGLSEALAQKASVETVEQLVETVNQKADSSAVAELSTNMSTAVGNLSSTVSTKASQNDLDALKTTVGTKADQSAVDELSTAVNGKADSGTVANLNAVVSTHAANQSNPHGVTAAQIGAATQAALDNLSVAVSGKADSGHSHTPQSIGALPTTGGTIYGNVQMRQSSGNTTLSLSSGSTDYHFDMICQHDGNCCFVNSNDSSSTNRMYILKENVQHPLLIQCIDDNTGTVTRNEYLLDSGNYYNYALPLAGGILRGPLTMLTDNDQAYINLYNQPTSTWTRVYSNNNTDTVIQNGSDASGVVSQVHFSSNAPHHFYTAKWANNTLESMYEFLHSGNFSQFISAQSIGGVQISLGSYDGNAAAKRDMYLGFQPKAVSIWNRNGMQGVANGVYGGFMAPGMPIIFHGNNNYDYVCAEVTSTGFKLYNANVNATNGQNLINNTNEHYYYMVFK